MAAPRAQMWGIYRFHGMEVRVIQQWNDPFGRAMVRIETVDAADPRAEGMTEAAFLAHADPISAGC